MNEDYKLIARDHFALACINGILANKSSETRIIDLDQAQRFAKLAYALADEMIKARQS